MEGLIIAIVVTVIVFVIFGRDEEGRTRFQRRQLKRAEQKQKNTLDFCEHMFYYINTRSMDA